MASLPSGDDSTRFCSTRCREAYDAGFPVWDESAELYGHRLTPPLTGWRVVIDASERKRRKIEKRKMRKNRVAKSKASRRASYESTDGPSGLLA
jgi:hypothetical protein